MGILLNYTPLNVNIKEFFPVNGVSSLHIFNIHNYISWDKISSNLFYQKLPLGADE
jgi:hypothetical protein